MYTYMCVCVAALIWIKSPVKLNALNEGNCIQESCDRFKAVPMYIYNRLSTT